MTKPSRTAAAAIVGVVLILAIAWVGTKNLGRSDEPGQAGTEVPEQRTMVSTSPSPSETKSVTAIKRAPIAPQAGADPLAFKVYRADLCFFAAARVRAITAAADGEPPSAAGRQRAVHACEMAASQTVPAAPALDKVLASFVELLKGSSAAAAFDEEWRRLGREIAAWHAENPVQPSGTSESERLARVAFERARSIVSRIALESNPAWASEGWLQSERAQFKDSIVTLARYGTQNTPEAWITIVEPALEALLRELQGSASGTDRGNANLMRVFLVLIEANQRAMFSN